MKKVVHVFYSGLGGHTFVFFSLNNYLKQKNYQSAAFMYGIEDPLPETIRKCEDQHLNWNFLKKEGKWDLLHRCRLAYRILQQKPDIVFSHGGYAVLFIYLLKWFVTGKKTRIYVRETQALTLKTVQNKVESFFSLCLSNKIIFLSDDYRQQAMKGIRKLFINKTTVISNGLDLTLFSPSGNKDGQTVHIGMQSRLVPIKDYKTLVAAVEVLVKQKGYTNIKLHIAGNGESADTIQAQIRETHMEEHVIMHGFLNQPQLIQFLDKLDIYVHSSLGETMSNSIMQAQAMQLPIVATDVFGINNVITDKENGFLFPLGDTGALVAILENLIQNKATREKFGKISRQYAEDHLSEAVTGSKYLKIFNSNAYSTHH